MAEQFHAGQEVEVYIVTQAPRPIYRPSYEWSKSKIIGWSEHASAGSIPNGYEVRFPDGTRAVFGAQHIRAIDKYEFADAIQRARSANQIP